MTRTARLLVGIAVSLAAGSARAGDDSQACSDTYVNAQTLRREHRLLEAREALRSCALSTCKAFIVKDCARWFSEVQAGLPTVVPIAADARGNDLAEVSVFVDGKVLLSKLDGTSVEVDPGPHTFVFQTTDKARVEKKVIVSEGEKGKRIAVTFDNAQGQPSLQPAAAEPPVPAESSAGPWSTVGLVMAGAGVVGAGVGAVFGFQAISKKNDAHCSENNVCPDDAAAAKLREARDSGTMATIFLVSGAVLVGGGITLFLLAPRHTVQVVPGVRKDAITLDLRGQW